MIQLHAPSFGTVEEHILTSGFSCIHFFFFFINPIGLPEESDWHYLQLTDPWPDLELFKKMPFDYIIHDPKYEDASLICSHHQSIKSEGQGLGRQLIP